MKAEPTAEENSDVAKQQDTENRHQQKQEQERKQQQGSKGPDGSMTTIADSRPKGEPGPAQAEKAEPEPAAESEAQSDSERTSKFIRLKSLEAPRATALDQVHPVREHPAGQPAAKAAVDAEGRSAAEAKPAPKAGPAAGQEPTPPIDLLAELTNTPPRPMARRRSVLRRVRIWALPAVLLAVVFAVVQLLRPLPAPSFSTAGSAHTLSGRFSIPWPEEGQGAIRVPGIGDVGVFGEQKPVPIASMAKVMTAYVLLQNHPLDKDEQGPQIEIDAKAVAEGYLKDESRIDGLTAGTRFSQQDMLKMLMIPSGNNIARLLARWDSGSDSEEEFVAKMNATAEQLGMNATTYTDPSGLDAGTVSTASDQLKLAEAVMRFDAFRAVVALPSADIPGLPEPLINNNDNLLLAPGLSVRGIKTGSNTPAGGALMWAAYKTVGSETQLILGTLLQQRADGPDENGTRSLALVKENSKKIIEAAREGLKEVPAVKKGEVVGHLDNGLGARSPVVAVEDLNVVGVPGAELKMTLSAGGKDLPRGAEGGTEIGVLTVGSGEGAKSVPVALQQDLTEPSFWNKLARLC